MTTSYWPSGRAGAISLSFDDGLPSQRAVALPAMNARGLRGTFYVNPIGSEDDAALPHTWREGLEAWRPARAAGHELANHSLAHACSLNIEMTWGMRANLLDWSLADVERDLLEAQRRLADVFPEQGPTSFAYPCYESTVGRGADRASYVPVVARHAVAGRARGELRGELANDPRYCDPCHLSSWAVERQAGAFMIGLAEQSAALGRWGIFTFHGIHEGHLPVGDTDFVELLDHLVRRQGDFWVAPVAEVAAYVRIHGAD